MLGKLGRACALVGVVVAGGCEDKDDSTANFAPPAETMVMPPGDAGVGDGPVAEVPGGEMGTGDGGMDLAVDLGPARVVELTVLHTNDLHSHLMGHGPEADYTPASLNDDATVGGFARIATAIGMYKAQAEAAGQDALLLDGGDFMMGTLFQLAATQQAAELQLMQAVGYDAVAMGNHELDWTPKGLAGILAAAVSKGVQFPVLASNLVFDATSPDDDDLAKLQDPGPLRKKLVKTLAKSGLKVGFFGLLGQQAQTFAPTARPLTFMPMVAAARAMANELRTVDKVDLVVALSHSGIGANGMGEDRLLAEAMPAAGVDLIISGHTHEKLEAPVVAGPGRTIIVTAGSYGQYLGRLGLEVEKRGDVTTAVRAKSYNLLPIDDKIAGAAPIQTSIDGIVTGLDQVLPVPYKAVVAQTSADLPVGRFAESGLGDLITDAYLASARALEPTEPAQLAVEVNGQIRAGIQKGKTGNVWLADVFRVSPLGIGPDGLPGSPLVTYYLTGKDIKSGLEIAAQAKTAGDDVYTMQIAGIEAEYDLKLPLFQRVTALRLRTGPTTTEPIDRADTTKCYKIVTTLYLAGLFGLAETVSGGLIKIQGKEKDCTTPANPFNRLIDSNPAAGVQELKNYQALLGYLQKLPDTDANNVPNIPASYATPAGRIKQTE